MVSILWLLKRLGRVCSVLCVVVGILVVRVVSVVMFLVVRVVVSVFSVLGDSLMLLSIFCRRWVFFRFSMMFVRLVCCSVFRVKFCILRLVFSLVWL